MEWIKLNADDDRIKSAASILCSDAKGRFLSVPAKEIIVKEQSEKGKLNENTIIRIEKCKNAVIMKGNTVLSSCGRPGDYMISSEEDLSGAKVFFVNTAKMSGKVFDSPAPIAFQEKNRDLCVSQDIRLQCSFYFSYRIKNPKIFMKYSIGESSKKILPHGFEAEMGSVFSVCLSEVLAQLSREGTSYKDVCQSTDRLTELMSEKLALAWQHSRGIELKSFVLAIADPNRADEKAFFEKCEKAQSSDNIFSEGFSEEFGELLKGLGQVAGDALNMFQSEMTSFFTELCDNLDQEMESSDEEDDENFDFDSFFDSCCTTVFGTWECPALRQIICFELLDAHIKTDGEETWRGDWQEKKDENGNNTVTSPTADSLGCYAYFQLMTDPQDDSEYLAGVISDTGTEKQFVKFFKKSE